MADITMCDGKGCSKKKKCYRYTAPKTPLWQSFFVTTPDPSGDKCEYFWDRK